MDAVAGNENLFRTERLVFRSIEDDDADFIHKCIESDPLNRALSSPLLMVPPTKESSKQMVSMLNKSLLAVMICLGPDDAKPTGEKEEKNGDKGGGCDTRAQAIGYLCINFGGLELPLYMHQHRMGRFGIAIATAFQDKGYGTEAVQWAVDWAFRFAGLHSVRLESVGFNERAQAVYQKVGFQVDGRLREMHYHDRKWYDVVSMSILEEDWEAARKRRASKGTK